MGLLPLTLDKSPHPSVMYLDSPGEALLDEGVVLGAPYEYLQYYSSGKLFFLFRRNPKRRKKTLLSTAELKFMDGPFPTSRKLARDTGPGAPPQGCSPGLSVLKKQHTDPGHSISVGMITGAAAKSSPREQCQVQSPEAATERHSGVTSAQALSHCLCSQ